MNPYLLINIKQQIYWPTVPTDWQAVDNLMQKIPHRLRVICAFEAAKLVIPIWEECTHISKKEREFLFKTVETIEKWIDRKATDDDVLMFGDRAYMISSSMYISAAVSSAICALARTSYSIAASDYTATNAIDDACRASNTNIFECQFYNQWWEKCTPLAQKEYDNFSKQIIEDI